MNRCVAVKGGRRKVTNRFQPPAHNPVSRVARGSNDMRVGFGGAKGVTRFLPARTDCYDGMVIRLLLLGAHKQSDE